MHQEVGREGSVCTDLLIPQKRRRNLLSVTFLVQVTINTAWMTTKKTLCQVRRVPLICYFPLLGKLFPEIELKMTGNCNVRTTGILLHNQIRFCRLDDHASKALLISLKLHIFCLPLTLRGKMLSVPST